MCVGWSDIQYNKRLTSFYIDIANNFVKIILVSSTLNWNFILMTLQNSSIEKQLSSLTYSYFLQSSQKLENSAKLQNYTALNWQSCN